MIEIIPNWHPVFVHFSIGLLLMAAVLFAASAFVSQSTLASQAAVVARWNLWIGTAFAVVTVAAGYRAYYTVAHDDLAHAAMMVHMKWAWAALVLFAVAAGLAWRERHRTRGAGSALAIFLAAGAGALIVTGYLGGENVYRHGLGVMRLPVAEGPGHAHEHGGTGHTHEHDEAGEAHERGRAGHAHEHGEPAPTHEHDDAGHAHEHGDAGHAHEASAHASTAVHADSASREPAAVVDAFHEALAAGDFEAAGRLLDPMLLVFEGGGTERSAGEYASHHMRSDAEFLRGAGVELLSRSAGAGADLAWVASESSISAAGGARIASKETMVLRNSPEGWRIAHIHWSSRPLSGGQ